MSAIAQHIAFARSRGWLPYYFEAAGHYGIPVELLLAKDSRESGLGSYKGLIANNWVGSDKVSVGISQINKAVWRFARDTDPNNVKAYVAKGAEILKSEIHRFKDVRTALAAYNRGAPRILAAIRDKIDPDSVTTGGDYAADILSRTKEAAVILGRPLPALPVAKASVSPWLAVGLGLVAFGVLKMREAA